MQQRSTVLQSPYQHLSRRKDSEMKRGTFFLLGPLSLCDLCLHTSATFSLCNVQSREYSATKSTKFKYALLRQHFWLCFFRFVHLAILLFLFLSPSIPAILKVFLPTLLLLLLRQTREGGAEASGPLGGRTAARCSQIKRQTFLFPFYLGKGDGKNYSCAEWRRWHYYKVSSPVPQLT